MQKKLIFLNIYCRSIMMHGFTVDENGQKMSKSIGNVIAPSDIIYGNKKVSTHNSNNSFYQ